MLHVVTATFSTPYLFRAFLMLALLGVVSGCVSVIVNLRGAEFNAEAMVHSVFPGVVAGFIATGTAGISAGAAVAAALASVALTYVHKAAARDIAEGAAVVLTTFYSIGIVLLLWHSDKSGQLEALMFGRLLEVTPSQLAMSAGVCAAGLAVIAATWKAQVFLAFDRTAARASGVRATLFDALLNLAIASIIVAGASAIGVLLVVGYLIVPGAAARLVAGTVSHMVPVSMAVPVGGGVVGMYWMLGDFSHPVSPQAAVSLSIVAGYVLCLLYYGLSVWVNLGRRKVA